jgi:hypothetical protein
MWIHETVVQLALGKGNILFIAYKKILHTENIGLTLIDTAVSNAVKPIWT